MATWLQLTGTPMGGDLSLLREAVAVAQHHDAVSGTEKQHVANDYARRLNQGVTECHKIIASYFKYERFTKLHLNQLYYVKLRRKGAVWASIFLAHHNLSHWKRAGSNELPIKFKPISTNSYRFGHDLIANWPKNCWNLFNMKVNEAAILEYFLIPDYACQMEKSGNRQRGCCLTEEPDCGYLFDGSRYLNAVFCCRKKNPLA